MIERSQAISERRTIPESLLSDGLWRRAKELSAAYRQNAPIPHIHIAEFLNPGAAELAAEEFPRAETHFWTQYKHYNEAKIGLSKKELFPPLLGRLTEEMNSAKFVLWVSQLTGISGLVPDPNLHGGGLHQCGRGGFLNLHTDFSTHYYNKCWRRRVNLIVYLNPAWRSEWGGAIEFWDRKSRTCFAKYPPLLNHAVVFNTDNNALHGFPDPLQCPETIWRKSVAFYYYTPEENVHSIARPTDYQARPSDSLRKRALIWLDKTAVGLYSRSKTRLGFSDDLASRILGKFSREK